MDWTGLAFLALVSTGVPAENVHTPATCVVSEHAGGGRPVLGTAPSDHADSNRDRPESRGRPGIDAPRLEDPSAGYRGLGGCRREERYESYVTVSLGEQAPSSRVLPATFAPALAFPQEVPVEVNGRKAIKGAIRGHIRFDGKRPAIIPLQVDGGQSRGCCPDGEPMNDVDRSLLISESLGIANVVVSLTVEGALIPVPKKPVVFDQKGCRFEPHVLVVPAGATVRFVNSDKCAHNVHIYCLKNQGFNRTLPAGKDTQATFRRSETIKINCDLHPWMSARVVVTEASHWAITDADGSFALEGIPPGTYELQVWQEKLGTRKATVTVAADGSCEPFEMKMAPKKPRRRARGGA